MKLPDDPDPLEARLARLRPADLPTDFRCRLLAAEPVLSRRPRWPRLPAFPDKLPKPWSLAYASLLAVWLLIFALRLATPPAPVPVAYSTALSVSFDPQATLPVVGGSWVDRSTLLASNHQPAANSLQP